MKVDTRKCKYRLEMIRGKRSVLIGEFPTKYRVEQIPVLLEWDGSWRPVVTKIKEEEVS